MSSLRQAFTESATFEEVSQVSQAVGSQSRGFKHQRLGRYLIIISCSASEVLEEFSRFHPVSIFEGRLRHPLAGKTGSGLNISSVDMFPKDCIIEHGPVSRLKTWGQGLD